MNPEIEKAIDEFGNASEKVGSGLYRADVTADDFFEREIAMHAARTKLIELIKKEVKERGERMSERIPIKSAKDIAINYGYSQVIIVAWDGETGVQHVTTYGKTIQDCEQAAKGGNFVKKALGWSDELCHDVPSRAKKEVKE
jgi:hypothetical protein